MEIKLNEFGIPGKPRYRNEDLANVLGVYPATIQWQCNRDRYGPLKKDGAGRRDFTIDDLRRIVHQEQDRVKTGVTHSRGRVAGIGFVAQKRFRKQRTAAWAPASNLRQTAIQQLPRPTESTENVVQT